MTIKRTVTRQYQRIVNLTASRQRGLQSPPEGWIVTVRRALGMSGTQLAKRLGVSRAAISRAQKEEITGNVTLKHMEGIASALGCRFVYAIVPDGKIEDLVRARAERKAAKIVQLTAEQMRLEDQAIPPKRTREAINELRDELIRDRPSDLWDDDVQR